MLAEMAARILRGRILFGRRQTGLPAVLLLKLCLRRYLKKGS